VKFTDCLRQSAVRGAGAIGFTETRYYDPAKRLSSISHDVPEGEKRDSI
jgi:hypothetical protein